MKQILRFSFVTVLSAFLLSAPAYAQNFAIVVNAENTSEADISAIKSLYLKQRTSWPDGLSADPFARSADSAEQAAFLSEVLGMSQADLDQYWLSEKSKTGLAGPRAVGSSSILMRQIKRKKGAFGVVTSGEVASLPEGVKVLLKF